MQAHLIEFVPTRTNNVISWQACYAKPSTTPPPPPPPACQGPPDYMPVILGSGAGNADQLFIFAIKDTSNLGIKFAATVDQALWIQPNTKPTGPGIKPPGQIVSASRVNDTMLAFLDKNNGANQLLKYTLKFVDSGGNSVTSIDPDIRNGGGRVVKYGTAELIGAFVLGAALVLALAAVAIRRMRSGAATNRTVPN